MQAINELNFYELDPDDLEAEDLEGEIQSQED